jgi:hypothetical protein
MRRAPKKKLRFGNESTAIAGAATAKLEDDSFARAD